MSSSQKMSYESESSDEASERSDSSEYEERGSEESEESDVESGDEREDEDLPRRSNKRDRGYVETKEDSRFVASDDKLEFVERKPHICQENILGGKRLRTKSDRFTIVHDEKAEREELRNAEDCEMREKDICDDDMQLFSLAIRDFANSRSVEGFFSSSFCKHSKMRNFVDVAKQNAGRAVSTNFSEDHFNELISCVVQNRSPTLVRQAECVTQCYYCCLKRTCSFSVRISNSHMPTHYRCENVGPECAALAQSVIDFIHGLIRMTQLELTRLSVIEVSRLHTAIMQAQQDKVNKYVVAK